MMIDNGQGVRLTCIIRGKVRYRYATESDPLASDDDFRWVQCSKIEIFGVKYNYFKQLGMVYRQAKPAWCIARSPADSWMIIDQISFSGRSVLAAAR